MSSSARAPAATDRVGLGRPTAHAAPSRQVTRASATRTAPRPPAPAATRPCGSSGWSVRLKWSSTAMPTNRSRVAWREPRVARRLHAHLDRRGEVAAPGQRQPAHQPAEAGRLELRRSPPPRRPSACSWRRVGAARRPTRSARSSTARALRGRRRTRRAAGGRRRRGRGGRGGRRRPAVRTARPASSPRPSAAGDDAPPRASCRPPARGGSALRSTAALHGSSNGQVGDRRHPLGHAPRRPPAARRRSSSCSRAKARIVSSIR